MVSPEAEGEKAHLRISRLETGFELLIEIVFIAWWNGLGAVTLLITLYKYAKGGWNRTTLTGGILIGLGELAIVYRILSFDEWHNDTGFQENPAILVSLPEQARSQLEARISSQHQSMFSGLARAGRNRHRHGIQRTFKLFFNPNCFMT